MPETVWKLGPEVFGATQHTPIFHDGHIFGTRPNGQFVCLGLDGKVVWASPAGDSFGLGPFLLADGLFFVMNDSGKLSLMEDSSTRFNLLAQAQVLKGRESWGPMALAGDVLARLHPWSVDVRRRCGVATSPAWSAWTFPPPRNHDKLKQAKECQGLNKRRQACSHSMAEVHGNG